MISKVAVFDHKSRQFSINDNKIDHENIGSQQVLVRQTVIAINEIDVADGSIRALHNLGYTACGEVVKCGDQVNWLQAGDRVAYFSEIGAYCQHRIIDSSKLIKVPDQIDSNVATAVAYRGIIAHMATVRTFIVREGIIALIDEINTVTSSVMGWMAKKRGAHVVGITSENVQIASNVCDVVIRKDSKNLVQDVINACKGIGAHLYIPSLNITPMDQVIQMLTPSAVIVDHIGYITDISVSKLMQKSLFLTAPSIVDYKSLRTELVLTFDEVISMMNERPLNISFSQYNLNQINEAFAEVSSGKSSSAVVLKL